MKVAFCFGLLTFGVLQAFEAHAACDFDKPIGSCEGSVTILSTAGSAPSFSTELQISSSAGACSKVEYRIDSMPVTSIIRSSGQEHESLFGTKPLTSGDIEVLDCTAYEGAPASSGSETAATDVLTGTWFNGSEEQPSPDTTVSSSTLRLVEHSGKVSGTATMTVTSVFSYEGRITDPISTDFSSKLSGTRKGAKVVLTNEDGKPGEYRLDGDKLWTPGGDYFRRVQ